MILAARAVRTAATASLLLALAPILRAAGSGEDTIVRSRGSATIRALEAALLLSGQEGGTIRIAVLAAPLPIGDDPGVHLLVEVDGAALLPDPPPERPRVDLVVYALTAEREVAAVASRSLPLDPTRHAATLRRTGLRTPVEMVLPPGVYDLRILVRTREGVFGVRSLELAVASPESPPMLPAPPLFEAPSDGWLVGVGERPPSPHSFVQGSPPPAALPVATPGEPARGQLLIRGLGDRLPVLTALLKENDSGELRELPLVIGERRATPFEGVEAVRFELPTETLRQGIYTLRVAAGVAGNGSAATPSIALIVAGPPAPGAWTEVDLETLGGGPGRKRTARRQQPAVDEPAGRLAAATIDERFDTARALLARGDLRAAAEALERLHRRAERGSGVTLPALADAEWSRLTRAAESGWEEMLPVLCLYAELTRGYRESRRLGLAHHAQQLARRLAEVYARELGTAAARDRAAAVLESLGAAAMIAGVLGGAAEAYAAALSLAGERPRALLGLGAVREKQGSYREAAQTFERLVHARPDHAEGRLRLALNLRRVGERERAVRLLDALTKLSEPEWVAIVAHQERVRMEPGPDRRGEAEEILRRGLDRFPGDPSLRLQLAWLLDSRRRSAEARPLLEQVDRTAPPEARSAPRYRYNAWPREALAVRPGDLLDASGAPPPGAPGGR